jgi:hypothetical protein
MISSGPARPEKSVNPRRSQKTTTTSAERASSEPPSPEFSTISATCGDRNRFSRAMRLERSCDKASSPAIWLNRPARRSSSSPVETVIR